MRYLVSVRQETIASDAKDQWAPQGEPVVPWYPATLRNAFLAIDSFKPAQYAKVVDDPNIDIDDIADRLCIEYPGIPKSIHNAYVLAIAKAAHKFQVGSAFSIIVEYDRVQLFELGATEVHTLWDKHPK